MAERLGYHRGTGLRRVRRCYNVEPFRGALRQGDWKLIWRTMLRRALPLQRCRGPSEKNNLAAANPDKVAAMQNPRQTAKEAGKPLFLVDQVQSRHEEHERRAAHARR